MMNANDPVRLHTGSARFSVVHATAVLTHEPQ